ncbi:MAG: ATP-binding cassette domain-containing protein [Terriglobia bacterium]
MIDPVEPAIELRNVCYTIDGHEIIPDLSFEVCRGETLVLLGRSGCGKTTLLKLMNGLLLPSAGEVLVEGKSTVSWDPIQLRRHIGYVIQEAGLFPHFTVERNVGLIPRLKGWPAPRVEARIEESLTLAGLDPSRFRQLYPRQLSGGQRQRVGVARALAGDPPILLMDEPFGALDPVTRSEIQREFLRLQQRVQKTVVLVTHDLREALLLATRIALIDSGRLAGVYSDAEFLDSTDPTVQQYVNAFRMDGGKASAGDIDFHEPH